MSPYSAYQFFKDRNAQGSHIRSKSASATTTDSDTEACLENSVGDSMVDNNAYVRAADLVDSMVHSATCGSPIGEDTSSFNGNLGGAFNAVVSLEGSTNPCYQDHEDEASIDNVCQLHPN